MSDEILEKPVWTDLEFERMEWHDATLHAIGFNWERFELLFDIDYLCKWVRPHGEDQYRFWVAPATLVFDNVYNLCVEVEPLNNLSIERVLRDERGRPRNAAVIGKESDWSWTIDLGNGSVSFRSSGFTQYFRREPTLSVAQRFTLNERGGIRFDRTGASKP